METGLRDLKILILTKGMTTTVITEVTTENEVTVEEKEVAQDHQDFNIEESPGQGREVEMKEVAENLLMLRSHVRSSTCPTAILQRILKS